MGRIVRYISENKFEKFKKDIAFLVDKIKKSNGELDLQLREDYFNIYHKGNSLAKVKVRAKDYEIIVHRKFRLSKAIDKDPLKRFSPDKIKPSGKENESYVVEPALLHPFFQEAVINVLLSEIKKVNTGEEIAFEQSLMTDNLGREDLIIIDRQVQWTGSPGKLDLLALNKTPNGTYKFVVLEVKLGNDPELCDEVASQLNRYVEAIKGNIQEFKKCYELNYKQKKDLGLFPDTFPKTISICEEVAGQIVVGFYSQRGRQQIAELLNKHPELDRDVIHFINKLEINL